MKKIILILVAVIATLAVSAPAQASTEKWRTVGTTWGGLGIQANQNTSTNFARHAGMAAQHGHRKIRVYSDAAHKFIVMYCAGGNASSRPFTCRGGNNAAVRLIS